VPGVSVTAQRFQRHHGHHLITTLPYLPGMLIMYHTLAASSPVIMAMDVPTADQSLWR
jgi:hypothetical protein